MRESQAQGIELEGEVIAEEDAAPGEGADGPVTVLARREASGLPVLREEVRSAAIAVAGGAIAGAATVAAVRAVGSAAKGGRRGSSGIGRRGRDNVVASRSFLIDVHVLGR